MQTKSAIVTRELTSLDMKAAYPSMMRKMRGLLHPEVKPEVNYAEATKDGSSNLHR